MERSRLPLLSLLGLFGALLMLSPELLLGIAGKLSDVPVTDPGVQGALAFAVQQYNQDRGDSKNHFKVLRVLMAQLQVEAWTKYSLLTQLVKTVCKKDASSKLSYKNLQKCKQLPGNPEEKTRAEYHVSVEMVETKCKKWTPWTFDYEKIQKCEQLPGSQEKPSCYFKVIPGSPPNKMKLEVMACS